MTRAPLAILLTCLLTTACARSSVTGGLSVAAQPEITSSEELEALLLSRDFEKIALERMATGHSLVHVSINGSTPRRFVCDTGSGATLVFPALAEELGLLPESTGHSAGGIGGQGMELLNIEIDSLAVGGVRFSDRELLVLDLSHLNQQFEAAGEDPIEGIIGAPWLTAHEVVLDIPANALFARP